MYKSILAILLVGLLAAPLMAGPTPPAGWGNDPCEWVEYDGVCDAVKAIYDPIQNGWYLCPDGGIVDLCQTVTVELWIEMYASMTVYGLNHYFHAVGDERARDAEFMFTIEGYTSSNNGLFICVEPGLDQDLGELAFISDIFGADDPNAQNIPIEWYLEWGGYNDLGEPITELEKTRVYPDDNGNICWDMPKCDHWWFLYGYFYLWYHIADGYYLLYYAIVPAPVL